MAQLDLSATNRNFGVLTNAGIDSVLVLRPWSQSFGAVQSLNPPIVFDAQVDVYVIRVSDGKVLHFDTLNYRSRERKFTEWGADGAKSFRVELKLAQRRFAECIAQEIFGP
jgi:hypothetical protein